MVRLSAFILSRTCVEWKYYAIQRLTHDLLGEFQRPAVFGRKCLDCTFLGFDIALDLPPAPLPHADLLRSSRNERVAQQVENRTLIKQSQWESWGSCQAPCQIEP